MTAETVEIKKEMGINKPDGTKTSTKTDVSAKKVMDATTAARAAKRRNERKEILQKQLRENTTKMNIIKNSKNQEIVKLFNFCQIKHFSFEKMSYIQLPYGLVIKSK